MIIARVKKNDDVELFILGLSKVNVERLLAGNPVHIRRETHREGIPEGWEIALIYGETEEQLYKELKSAGGIDKDTKIKSDPRLGIDPNT